MSPRFRQKIATILLVVYVPVMFSLGLQHHDGPLYPPPSGLPATVTATNPHNVSSSSLDQFCMACHFASRHFFEQPFHIFSAVQNIAFLVSHNPYELAQIHIHYARKRAPPVV